jgi:hypothetical protein
MEDFVLFFARRADATYGAADEHRDSQGNEYRGQVTADGRHVCEQFVHIGSGPLRPPSVT